MNNKNENEMYEEYKHTDESVWGSEPRCSSDDLVLGLWLGGAYLESTLRLFLGIS